jgi:hypothetical protein
MVYVQIQYIHYASIFYIDVNESSGNSFLVCAFPNICVQQSAVVF